jgi:hypothetical protein
MATRPNFDDDIRACSRRWWLRSSRRDSPIHHELAGKPVVDVDRRDDGAPFE